MFYAKIEFLTYKDIISQIHMSNGDIFAHCCKNWIENWFYINVNLQIGRYVLKKSRNAIYKIYYLKYSCVWFLEISRNFFFKSIFQIQHLTSAVDRGFDPWPSQINDNEIGICCFSAKHAALRRKSKDWSARNQNNVSEWLLF